MVLRGEKVGNHELGPFTGCICQNPSSLDFLKEAEPMAADTFWVMLWIFTKTRAGAESVGPS